MRVLKFITGHVIYNPAYTCKFQLKTTKDIKDNEGWNYNFTNECCKVLSLEWTFNDPRKNAVEKIA